MRRSRGGEPLHAGQQQPQASEQKYQLPPRLMSLPPPIKKNRPASASAAPRTQSQMRAAKGCACS
jgi:hypothetical protein